MHNRILFQAFDTIGQMEVDGTQRRTLAVGSDLEAAGDGAVSSDGRQLAFIGIKAGQHDLFIMNVDGTGRRQLTNDLARERDPAWAPDGASLLFTWVATAGSPVGGSPTLIVSIGTDGTNRREVVVDGEGGQWSPDGHQIAFAGFGSREAGLYVMNIDDGAVTGLRGVCGPRCYGIAPRWSPDGQFLAFLTALDDGRLTAAVVRPDGTNARLILPALVTLADGPAWSPDGQRLAITRQENDGGARIYLVTLETGDTVSVSPADAYEGVSDWAR